MKKFTISACKPRLQNGPGSGILPVQMPSVQNIGHPGAVNSSPAKALKCPADALGPDLISLMDTEDADAFRTPILAFNSGRTTSVASGSSLHTAYSADDLPLLSFSPLAKPLPAPAAPAPLVDEMSALREALVGIRSGEIEERVEMVLGILLMLPKKQRLRCLLSSQFLAVKARAAVDLLLADVS